MIWAPPPPSDAKGTPSQAVSYGPGGINLVCQTCRLKPLWCVLAAAAAPVLVVGAVVAAPVALPAMGGYALAHAPVIAHAVVSGIDTAITLAVPAPLSTILTAGNTQIVSAASNN